MINKPFKNTIKIISLVLSLVMVWQNVVWANPDVTKPNTHTLQAPSMFTQPDAVNAYRRAFTGYLTNKIIQTELDPEMRNVSAMYRKVSLDILDVRRGFASSGRAPEIDPIDFVKITETLSGGFFMVDMGESFFRYFDPNISDASDPGQGYEIVEEVSLGKYLARQKLIKTDHGDGFIARGNAGDLVESFVKSNNTKTPLRKSLTSRLPKIKARLFKRAKGFSLGAEDEKQIEKIITDSLDAEFIEFDGIVLPGSSIKRKLSKKIETSLQDYEQSEEIEKAIMIMGHTVFFDFLTSAYENIDAGKDLKESLSPQPEFSGIVKALEPLDENDLKAVTKDIYAMKNVVVEPGSWLLGFNTVTRGSELSGARSEIAKAMGEQYPNTIAFAGEILDLLGKDNVLIEEYLFHEIVCPYLGHERSREIQETIFPENYGDSIVGDNEAGHTDGELSLVIKKVLYDKTLRYNGEILTEEKMQDLLTVFESKSFKGDGPPEATRIYAIYAKWHALRRQELLWEASRVNGSTGKNVPEKLEGLAYQNKWLFSRLTWIWDCSIPWDALESYMDKRGIEELSEPEKEKAVELAQAVKDAHWVFTIENALPIFPSKEYLEDVMREVDGILYGKTAEEEEAIFSPASEEKEQKQVKTAGKKQAEVKVEKEEDENRREARGERLEGKSRKEKKVAAPVKKGFWRSVKDWYLMFSFRNFIIMMSIAVAVSFILYLVLPVNMWTRTIATVIPLTFFIIILARNFSWKGLLSAIAISAILSYFLPLPWLGLSMVITVLIGAKLKGYSNFAKRPKGMPASSSRKASSVEDEDEGEKTKEKSGAAEGEEEEDRQGARGEKQEENAKGKETKGEGQEKNKGEEGESQGERQEGKEEKTDDPLDKIPDEWNPLKDVMISFDVVKVMFQLIALLYPKPKEKEKSEEKDSEESQLKEKLDTRRVLDAIFRLDYDKELEYKPSMKDDLRQYVFAWFEKPERTYDSNFLQYDRILQNWKVTSDKDLSNALNEITQEVSQYVLQANGPNSVGEMTAVQALVAERYAIEEGRLQSIRRMLGLLTLRERVKSGELIGNVEAKEYYTLGRFEFYFEYFDRSERAFASAIGEDPDNKDYYLTVGIVDHYNQHWDKAEGALERAINLREDLEGADTIDEKKLQLARLLLKKVRKRITLNGDKADDDAFAKSYLANISDNLVWKVFVLGSTVFHELGHLIYSKFALQNPRLSLKGIIRGRIHGVSG